MNRNEGPYLQWEFRSGSGVWFPDEVILRAPDGRELWRRMLPERMRSCPAAPEDVENQRRFPRNPQLSFLLGLEWTDAAVAVADRETVLVLALADGRVLLEASFPGVEGETPFWCDAGEFRILGSDVAGKVRGGRFFARCGGEWLYFNGGTLAAIDAATAAVRETTRYRAEMQETPPLPAAVRATIPLGPRAVRIDGVIFM